jgi:hypothetical protein
LASRYPFSPNTITILTLLCQQASISIANALLFRSVQAGTRENLKMIAAQRDALEAARKSREDALKATKVHIDAFIISRQFKLCGDRSKATFWLRWAMSYGHHLGEHCKGRVEFCVPTLIISSFYGLLDLLSGTELNPGQGEIGAFPK